MQTESLSHVLLEDGPGWLVPAVIKGAEQVGSTLTVKWIGLPVSDSALGLPTQQGQWYRNRAPIVSTTQASCVTVAADDGQRIGFLESTLDKHGSRQQMSSKIAIGIQTSRGTA